MPIDSEVQRELARLTGQIAALDGSMRRLAERMAQLEKASPGPQIMRLVEAANQFGDMWAYLLQNQTRTNQPVKPWRSV